MLARLSAVAALVAVLALALFVLRIVVSIALLMVSAVAGLLYLAVELAGRRVWWRAL